MKYAPEGAAKNLKSQNNAHEPHGAGTKPPVDGRGHGMSHHTAQAAKCLHEWGEAGDAPDNHGRTDPY